MASENQRESPPAGGAFQDTVRVAARAGVLKRTAVSRARPYVLAVVAAGCIVLVHSIVRLRGSQLPLEWWTLVALTIVSGSAVLKLPAIPSHFSISDVFTLTAAVVAGPAGGTVLVAIDSLAISRRLARTGLPIERIVFNAAAPPLAMWLSAQAFSAASGIEPLGREFPHLEVVGPWLFLFAGLYFLLNTFGIAIAIALHERMSALAIWRAHFQNLWVTFVGGAAGAACVLLALQLGTYGLAVLLLPLLLAFILHFAYRNATGRVSDQLHHLAEVNRLHLSTIEALAHAIDAKDAVTHGHIRRVQGWAMALAARIGLDDEQELKAIEAAALLHDIGKLAVPEHILNKPGALTEAEFERMKAHARVGAEILSEVAFPYPVVPIVRHHHENWDGSGYPDGVRGAAIPIGARILSVVDCFDALTSDRPYRRALAPLDAFAIIEARSGRMYDPAIVEAFRAIVASTIGDMREPSPADRGQLAVVREGDASRPVTPDALDHLRTAVALGAALSNAHGAEAWRMLCEAVRTLPGVDAAVVFEVDERQHRLVALHASGTAARRLAGLSMPVGERISGWVAAARQPMVNGDAALDLFDAGEGGLRTAVAVPCEGAGGRRLVVTVYASRTNALSRLHQQLIEAAARFLSDAPAAQASASSSRSGRGPGRRPHREQVPRHAWSDDRPDGTVAAVRHGPL